MDIKRIKFVDYISPPQTICKIQTLCAKPQEYANLINDYQQEDIDKLIELGHLVKDSNGAYIDYLSKLGLPQKVLAVKLKLQKVFYLLHLRSQILQLRVAKKQFDELMVNLSGKYFNVTMTSFNISDNDKVKIEYYVNNIISIIYQIREVLKESNQVEGVLKTTGNEVTGKLVKKYCKYQSEFDEFCKLTILKPEVYKFNDFLRNRALHGGRMNYSIAMHRIHLGAGNFNCAAIALCDYSLLEDSSSLTTYSNVKDNLFRYYYDDLVATLQLRINENIPYELDNMLYENINEGLQIAFNDKNIDINQFSKSEMIELLQNKEKILFMYNTWKERRLPSMGQFAFNMSELIYNLYDTHHELYIKLYDWVKAEYSQEIQEFHQANYELINLVFQYERYSSVDKNVTFDLE